MSQAATGASDAPTPSTGGIGTRNRTYLIAKNDQISVASAGPLDFDWLVEQMQADAEIRVAKILQPRDFTLQRAGDAVVREVVVATMPESKAAQLEQHPQVVLEEDHLLLPLLAPLPDAVDGPAFVSPFGAAIEWQIDLRTPAGEPVAGATVYLYGSGIPAQAISDASGRVTLSLLNETDATLRALYVNPLSDLWSLWVNRPALISGIVNTVTLEPLSQTFAGFPGRQLLGWGQKAMGLDQVPPKYDGATIRVGVIDSGAAARTHPDLRTIVRGLDVTSTPASEVTWSTDTIAHGSHCSGVIAGADDASGVRGFAPAAEMHEARIFPGGRLSSLLDALDYCIDQQLDVVNMSLGTGGSSQIVLQKLAQARQQGVACIVAAGNSGDAVQFPGSSPDVLTVSAIGQEGQFPDSSYHAQQRWTGGTEDGGFFSAQFSCHGPEVDVCGPGVAIVSSVPPAGFAAWDGTSMATPHVTGLAALVLAHHPDFRTPALQLHTAARVDRLFALLKAAARPLAVGDPTRVGAGLPDAKKALGLTGAGAAAQPDAATQAAAVRDSLDRLRAELVAADLTPPVSPFFVARPTLPFLDTRRQLAVLRAQMSAAGLSVAASG